MNKRLLKSIRDKIPESLKYITAPIFRNKLLKDQVFCKYTNLLENRELLSFEKINEYQFDQLKHILKYSFQNVPYYTDLFNKINFKPEEFKSFDDIKVIPFLTKEIIRENFDKLISSKEIKGGCYSTTTSGSTGEPLKLLLDYKSFFKENAFIYYFRKKLGYHYNDRLVTFRGIDFGGKMWRYNPMHNEFIFSPLKLTKRTLELYRGKINEIKPDYLNGYFSSIYYFAKLLSENNQTLNFRLKGIFLSSENIDEDERLFVESFFQVKSLTFYGHTERCVIAQELRHNEYLFDPYYGFTEQVSINDNTFEIVGTGFINKTMPLIRYKTDDLCKISSNGSVSVVGRRDIKDFLIGTNDEKIFSSSLHSLSDILNNVAKHQFIQNEKGKAILLIVPDKGFKCSEVASIKSALDKAVKDVIDFEIKVEEKVVLTSGGKYQMFIRTI